MRIIYVVMVTHNGEGWRPVAAFASAANARAALQDELDNVRDNPDIRQGEVTLREVGLRDVAGFIAAPAQKV